MVERRQFEPLSGMKATTNGVRKRRQGKPCLI
jgi:hypothetical protein